MNPSVVAYARWAAYGLLVLSLIPAVLAILDLGKSRKASYYAIRRAAVVRVARWLVAVLVMLVLAVLLLVVPPAVMAGLPSIVSSPSPAPIATPSSVPHAATSLAPTDTSTPLPSATPNRRPTATPPLIPTATAGVALPPDALTPLPSAVPAAKDAHVELLALAMAKDRQDEPVQPGSEFPPGRHPVLLFIHYEGMNDGAQVTFAWSQDGQFLEPCSDTWLLGEGAGREWGEEGWSSYECNPAAGWEPGSYEIRVFIEARLQGVAQYVVTER